MKKLSLLFALVFTLASATTFAQTVSKWGIYAGTNFNTPSKVENGASKKTTVGFDMGAKYQLHFNSGLFLDFGLGLDYKNIKLSESGLTLERKALGLQMPIHLGYMYNINDSFAIFGSAGPYMTIGLSGEYKGSLDALDTEESIDLYEKDSGDDRFEAGLGLKVGVQFIKHIQVSLGYDFGLTELNEYSDGLKNRTINLGVAYMF